MPVFSSQFIFSYKSNSPAIKITFMYPLLQLNWAHSLVRHLLLQFLIDHMYSAYALIQVQQSNTLIGQSPTSEVFWKCKP